MSNIVNDNNTEAILETTGADGGLEVICPPDQESFVEIRGDADVGIIGGQLTDTIITGAGDANVFTGQGNDEIQGGTGGDVFRGGLGDDILRGGLGADTLLGGQGDDILIGGLGQSLGEDVGEDGNPLEVAVGDVMSGGTGDDVFSFFAAEIGTGVDRITDFNADGFADKIRIFGVGADANIEINNGIISVDGNELVDIGDAELKDTDGFDNNYNEDADSWDLF